MGNGHSYTLLVRVQIGADFLQGSLMIPNKLHMYLPGDLSWNLY